MAYRLDLPTELLRIYNIFHVSMLCKYIADPSHISGVSTTSIEEKFDLHRRASENFGQKCANLTKQDSFTG